MYVRYSGRRVGVCHHLTASTYTCFHLKNSTSTVYKCPHFLFASTDPLNGDTYSNRGHDFRPCLYCSTIAVELDPGSLDGSALCCTEGDINTQQANFRVTARPPELPHSNQRALYHAIRPQLLRANVYCHEHSLSRRLTELRCIAVWSHSCVSLRKSSRRQHAIDRCNVTFLKFTLVPYKCQL